MQPRIAAIVLGSVDILVVIVDWQIGQVIITELYAKWGDAVTSTWVDWGGVTTTTWGPPPPRNIFCKIWNYFKYYLVWKQYVGQI